MYHVFLSFVVSITTQSFNVSLLLALLLNCSLCVSAFTFRSALFPVADTCLHIDTGFHFVNVLTRHITPGTGTQGYSGDGSAATSASLYYPTGVALDSTGNLYIAVHNNYRIRKVATTGVITTIAGTEHAVAVCLVPCLSLLSV